MSSSISRDTYNALLPPGALWVPENNGDFDLFLEGISDNAEIVAIFLKTLANNRDPFLTTILSDLEKEYGIVRNDNLTETERRTRLSSYVFNRGGTGTIDDMQRAINLLTGLENVNVYSNDPAVDPNPLDVTLLANGKKLDPTYTMPTDPDAWPLIFFVAGDATFGGSGEILTLGWVEVNRNLEEDLRNVILKYKPLHCWAGAKVVLSDNDYYQITDYTKMATANIQKGMSTYTTFVLGRNLRYDDIF